MGNGSHAFPLWYTEMRESIGERQMHIGRFIRQKVMEKGMTVVWFAEQMACTRVNAYKIFSRKSIDTDSLMRISRILDFDFFQLYSARLKEEASADKK